MDWILRLNQALEYIEKHLSGEIDYEKAAKIACCSTYHFQRMFSYMAGVPLAEYIRRRRMSLAAVDLQKGSQKVIEIGMKYGYESPTAFNRAFQSVHGIAPSQAKEAGICLKAYPPISFQITIKGVAAMEYRIENKESIRIIGVSAPLKKEIEKNFETVPKLWSKVASDGSLNKLLPLMKGEPKGVLGVSACIEGEDWRYFISVANAADSADGFEEYTIPAATWAVFPGEGTMPDSVQELEKRIITEWLPSSGYEYGNAPDMEVYLNADPANAKFEIWIPVVKKAE